MTRTKRNSGGGETAAGTPANVNDLEWGGFINVRMNDEEKADFHTWNAEHEATVMTDFLELVARGFKFGLSYDPDGDFYLATFTAGGLKMIGLNARACMTARAPDWFDAVALLVYKHVVLAKGNWGAYRPATLRFDNFG